MNCDTWPTPDTGCVSGCDIPTGTDPDLLLAASIQAGVILRTLSGGRAGTCEDTVRPLPECSTCTGSCTCCGAGDRIRLESPLGPVVEVTTVWVDGAPLDADTWRFYPSGQLLYRVPPNVWPTRDTKWADCSDPGTMCVDVVAGYEPDAWALAVHAELTCELIKSCTGGQCRIPSNATQVTGQGITIALTPAELKQFIPAVAGWVAAINPNNAQHVTRVYSPDLGSGRSGSGVSTSGGTGIIDGGGP